MSLPVFAFLSLLLLLLRSTSRAELSQNGKAENEAESFAVPGDSPFHPNERKEMQQQKAPMQFTPILAHLEYKSSVRLFGTNYFFTVGFAGTINGRMLLSVRKEVGEGREEVLADFGAEMAEFEGSGVGQVRDKREAQFVLQLNDYLKDYLHRTVMELTDKAMAEKSTKQSGTGIKEDPAVLDENFTRQLADRMLKDLGESKEFGHIFRKMNPTHPAEGKKAPELMQSFQTAVARIKDRLTPIQLGPTLIQLSLMQDINIADKLLTRMNIRLDMEMRADGMRSCFEILARTKERKSGRTLDVHLKATESAPPQVCVFRSDKQNSGVTSVHNNPLEMVNFMLSNFGDMIANNLLSTAKSVVVTAAAPAFVVLAAHQLIPHLMPLAQIALVAVSGGKVNLGDGNRKRGKEHE